MSSKVRHYPVLEKAQRDTWDSVNVPNIQTVYYMANNKTLMKNDILYIQGKEDHSHFYTRTRLAIDYILQYNWDYVFKTDNSAFIDKNELVKVVSKLPQHKVYAGKPFHDSSVVPVNNNFMWGEGYLLSRDMAKIVARSPNDKGMAEDYTVSTILNQVTKGIELPFYNYFKDDNDNIPKVHLYRCFHENPQLTIQAMHNLMIL